MMESPKDQEPPDFLAVDESVDDEADDGLDDFGEPPLPTHDIEPFGRPRH